MTDSVESVLQKSREEFEKAITKLGLPLSFHIDVRTGEYLFNGTQWAWRAWQASRSALEPNAGGTHRTQSVEGIRNVGFGRH